jgi:hypothetical protein
MASPYQGSETDNSSHNGGTGQSSPQPLIAIPIFPSGGAVNATVFGTSTAAGGAYPSQSDGSTVGVNPVPGQSYQSQPGHQRYSYYGQSNTYDNQTGAHINYGNMPQYNRFSYAGYGSGGIGQLSGVFGASSPTLVNTSYASTPLTMSTISLASPPSPPPTGSGPTMTTLQLSPVQDNSPVILNAVPIVYPSSPTQTGSGPTMVVSQLEPVQEDASFVIGTAPIAPAPPSPSPSPPPIISGPSMPVPPPEPEPDRTNELNNVLQDSLAHAQAGPTEPTELPPDDDKQEKRYCGLRRRTIWFIVLGVCIAIALFHFFIWPRVPDTITLDDIYVSDPISPYAKDNANYYGFRGEWYVRLNFDSDNFVSQTIETLDVSVYLDEPDTYALIGSGTETDVKLSRGEDTISVPVDILYMASGPKDPTLIAMEESCINGTYVDIHIHVELTMNALSLKKSVDLGASYGCKA